MVSRTIHFTLDFEADLGSAAPARTFEAVARTDRLLQVVRRLGLPLTVFCEGEILERRYELVQPLVEQGAEIELHAYDHAAAHAGGEARLRNLEAGLRAYRARFGRAPNAYRAPDGMIGRPELRRLAEEGVRYDSSVFPTMFPGRFDFSHCPRTPFRIKRSALLELPFATIGRLRIPVSLSYCQLVGTSLFKVLLRTFGVPDELVFDFHMHDLVNAGWHRRPGVSFGARLGYARAQALRDPARVLEDLAEHFLAEGYRPEPLSALYARAAQRPLPEVGIA